MAATVRRKYKITIKLTNNDENDEKEFIITNMKQILLQNFAEEEGGIPRDLSGGNSFIYMLKDIYYIDNEVLKNIRGTKAENNKYAFKNFNSTTPAQIINEFYTPILSSTDTVKKIKILLQILQFAKESIENSDKIDKIDKFKNDKDKDDYTSRKNERKESIDSLDKKIEEINRKQENSSLPLDVKQFSELFDDIITILVDKDVMSYLKSIYDNTDDKRSVIVEFRQNLSNIMLKINSDPSITNELKKMESYRYFLEEKYIDAIFESIQNNISKAKNNQQPNYGSFNRINLLNTPEMYKQIIKDNIKYVYPDKTNIEALAESEEQDILLFHNILYIIKKIYLLDTTIIFSKDEDSKGENQEKKFYIKNLTLEQNNPFKLEKIKRGDDTYNVFINFKCDIKYINENPLLKINYIIDDKEVLDKTNNLKITEFDPKNFNKNQDLKKYKTTYIYDTIDYKLNNSKIEKILNTIKIQKIIKTKEELFYNDIALNEFNKLLNVDFNITDNDKKKKLISSNIVYFLKYILKLYNGKEITHDNVTYFVYDTLILDDALNDIRGNIISNTNPVLNFYSISKNKSIKYNNFKGEKILKNILKKYDSLQLRDNEKVPFYDENFKVYSVESKDKRIVRNTYYIFILFLCYKADEKGNRPSFQKRVIGEVCLERAKILDKAFYDLFYSKLNIPETFLYNKLLNLQKSKQSTTVKNKEIPQAKELPPNLETLETKIKGGKKKYTRKIKLTS
jgi:hypothetical protein